MAVQPVAVNRDLVVSVILAVCGMANRDLAISTYRQWCGGATAGGHGPKIIRMALMLADIAGANRNFFIRASGITRGVAN
jgi:hypothetical protein